MKLTLTELTIRGEDRERIKKRQKDSKRQPKNLNEHELGTSFPKTNEKQNDGYFAVIVRIEVKSSFLILSHMTIRRISTDGARNYPFRLTKIGSEEKERRCVAYVTDIKSVDFHVPNVVLTIISDCSISVVFRLDKVGKNFFPRPSVVSHFVPVIVISLVASDVQHVVEDRRSSQNPSSRPSTSSIDESKARGFLGFRLICPIDRSHLKGCSRQRNVTQDGLGSSCLE
jgi:hypothetical protein